MQADQAVRGVDDGHDKAAARPGPDIKRMESYANVKSTGVGLFSTASVIQSLTWLIHLPHNDICTGGTCQHIWRLLLANVMFSILGLLVTTFLSSIAWKHVHGPNLKKCRGATLPEMLNYIVLVSSLGVTITSGVLVSVTTGTGGQGGSSDANLVPPVK